MQALEKPKNSLLVLGVDTYAVVTDCENPLLFLPFGRDMYDWGTVRAAVLDGVADKILKQLLQMRRMHAK